MSFIVRPIKPVSGTVNYIPDTTILSAEVNADFNTIYDDYDGNIDNNNIAANAGILYSKLNLTGGIVNNDVSTSANIARAKLAVPASVFANMVPNLNFSAETTICSIPLTVPAAATVIFTISGSVEHHGLVGIATITWRWKRDSTTHATVLYVNDSNGNIVTLLPPGYVDTDPTLTAGAHTWTLTAAISAGQLFTSATPGSIYAVEVR